MTKLWSPVSTQFHRDPRVRAAGKDGALLFVVGLGYCTEHLTDGFIPKDAIPVLAAEAWTRTATANRLVEHGLWSVVDGGFAVAGWGAWNRSRDEIENHRFGARQRQARKRARDAASDGVTRDTGEDVTLDVTRDSHHTPTPTPTDTPPSPPDGGVPDARVVEALTIAVAGERPRARAAKTREHLEHWGPKINEWMARWPEISADQIAAAVLEGGRLPQTIAYLAETDPSRGRPHLEVIR